MNKWLHRSVFRFKNSWDSQKEYWKKIENKPKTIIFIILWILAFILFYY